MKSKRYIVSGGPGSGKTTLIEHLKILGYQTRREVAREMIESNLEHGGRTLPWINRDIFDNMIASISGKDFIESGECPVVFFDGCMLDIVPWRRYLNLDADNFDYLLDKYPFEREVFVPEPWKDIYVSDAARPFAYEDSVAITTKITEFYEELNFQVISVPKAPPMARAKFVLQILRI